MRKPSDKVAPVSSFISLITLDRDRVTNKYSRLLKGVLALCRLDEISFARPFAHIDVSELISKVDRLPKSQPNPRLALALDRGDSMVEVSMHQSSLRHMY